MLNKVIKSPYFVVISVTIVIVFSLAAGMQNYGSSFIQDFISNWLATLLGAMIGVPLALWVSGIQERKIESGKKTKILSLLKDELAESSKKLSEWENSQNKREDCIYLCMDLQDEAWRAFSDGGELEWISDPALLSVLSEAFALISSVKKLGEWYIAVGFVANPPNQIIVDKTWGYLERKSSEGFRAIDEALEIIIENL